MCPGPKVRARGAGTSRRWRYRQQMAVADSRRTPVRASDAERERSVRDLRDAVVAGRLAHDSFVRRVDLALQAKHRSVLAELTSDLPRRWSARPFAAVRGQLVRAGLRLRGPVRTPRPVPLCLPPRRHADYSIGWGAACDLMVHDATVSRVHAALRCFGDQWFLVDLGSTNGTRVNGFRVRRSFPVVPGDVVALGSAFFRIQPAAGPRRRPWSGPAG